MRYEDACSYLDTLDSFGIKPGLQRIKSLLKRLGNPEKNVKMIHVAGTNGKGSVSSFIHEAIITSGLTCGIYTSPHLLDYTERIRVGREDISKEALAHLISRVKPEVDAMIEGEEECPTQFEFFTACMFLHFSELKLDYAVIEVGMGGLLDSTNVIVPEVSIITNVSMDHESYCGTTVEEIAKHKAGIIKEGVPLVTAAQGSPLSVIKDEAFRLHAPIYVFDQDFSVASRRVLPEGQMITVEWRETFKPAMLITRLRGLHQTVNLACATMAMKLLMEKDSRLSEDAMRIGFSNTFWPGRFEVVKKKDRIFLFDGAHNAGGAEAFAMTYEEVFQNRPKTVVFAIMQDKDLSSLIKYIIKEDDVLFAVPAPTPRTMAPEDLAKAVPCKAYACESIREGMEKAVETTQEGDIIVVCGSLYILGESREFLK